MTRTELVALTAVLLLAAFLLGWGASWLAARLGRASRAEMGELERMAQALHAAEEERDATLAQLAAREAALSNRINQTEAELSAAMGGLRAARAENEALRARLPR